mmetsp:Transcript_59429/g.192146  ORF Transcript_59429/g.192146 Transcript_59429/m.192146 type:complete len:952 (-) Transcript_59429:40-2895(-)
MQTGRFSASASTRWRGGSRIGTAVGRMIRTRKKEKQREERAERLEHGQEREGGQKNKKERHGKDLLDKERMRSLLDLIVSHVEEGQKPVLAFCFSKGACESVAEHLLSSGRLANAERDEGRAAKVRRIIKEELKFLPEEDRTMTQVLWGTETLLPRGIGVHHGGLVPALREITEMVFKQGLLDVLVCTETFGMGLNMPARTVIFRFQPARPLTKFDGTGQRALTPTEYLQMSGRAGRRMLDPYGRAILALDDPFPPADLRSMLAKQNPAIRSHYEMQAGSALQLLRHGRGFVDWFGLQTLLQFESRACGEPVLQDEFNKLAAVLKHPDIGLVDDREKLTTLGRACMGMACGDVLLMSRLLREGCFDEVAPLDLFACLTVFILERPAQQEEDEMPVPVGAKRFLAACETQAEIVDRVIEDAGLLRRCDASDGLLGCLRQRRYLVGPFRATWLSGSSFDGAVHQCTAMDPGTMVRVIRRVDECAAEVQRAARRLGSEPLAKSIGEARKQLHRGPPFSESLYFPKELRGRSEDEIEGLRRQTQEEEHPWESPYEPGRPVHLDPCIIGFSHNSVQRSFQNGTPLKKVLRSLLRGEEGADGLAASMKVVFYRGQPYTLGNRRLAVLRMYAWSLPPTSEKRILTFIVASPAEAEEWGWEQKFTTGCFRGARAVIRGTGEVIGVSAEDSLCRLTGLDEEEEEEEEDATSTACASDLLSDAGSGFWAQWALLPAELRDVADEDRATVDGDVEGGHVGGDSVRGESMANGRGGHAGKGRGKGQGHDEEVVAQSGTSGSGKMARERERLAQEAERAQEEQQVVSQRKERESAAKEMTLEVPERIAVSLGERPFGMTPSSAAGEGYLVAKLSEGKPAAKAGVRLGWCLAAVAGKSCTELDLEATKDLLKNAGLPVDVEFEALPSNGEFCTACQRVLLAAVFSRKMRTKPPDKRRCDACVLAG